MKRARGVFGDGAATHEGTSGSKHVFPIKISGCENRTLVDGVCLFFLFVAFWSLSHGCSSLIKGLLTRLLVVSDHGG